MRRALSLAARARGATHPNPMVGAVVVAGDAIIGEGFHRRAGEPHAEVLALALAGERAEGATLYVTMEPCNHQGRMPPCTRAIIKAGVARVVVGMQDPNPEVVGKGLATLRQAGIEVEQGLLEEECRRLNEDWILWLHKRRPFISIKAAVTLDGWIAASSGNSRWISGDLSRRQVMRLRARSDAVLVGSTTLLRDDPRLSARLRGARQPLRVALDPELRCPLSARMIRDPGGPVLLLAAAEAPLSRQRQLEAAGAAVLRVPTRADGRIDLRRAVLDLGRRGIISLLVEGGGELYRDLLDLDLVDRAHVFVAPRLLGGVDGVPLGGRRPGATHIADGWRLRDPIWRRFGEDMLVSGVPERSEVKQEARPRCSPG